MCVFCSAVMIRYQSSQSETSANRFNQGGNTKIKSTENRDSTNVQRGFRATPTPQSGCLQKFQSLLARLFVKMIRTYQRFWSPMWGSNCRYFPSCSQYSLEAIERFGAVRGFYMTVKRVLKCSPFSRGGIDQVPDQFNW
jgi:putative membrane protein insertion efficiency factor